jgi:hypothetical protein
VELLGVVLIPGRTGRRGLSALFLLAALALPHPARAEVPCEGRQVHRTGHFTYCSADPRDHSRYIDTLEAAYPELCETLGLSPEHTIRVDVYPGQREFLRELFGGRPPPGVTSVGMARPREQTILLTSYHDATTGRTLEEYLRVARHELVHVLMPHEHTWLQEGLALYLAGQERDFLAPPRGPQDIKDHVTMNITNREAYGYYSWLTRHIIRRSGFAAYLEFYRGESPDFRLLGYEGVDDFCARAYEALRSELGPGDAPAAASREGR